MTSKRNYIRFSLVLCLCTAGAFSQQFPELERRSEDSLNRSDPQNQNTRTEVPVLRPEPPQIRNTESQQQPTIDSVRNSEPDERSDQPTEFQKFLRSTLGETLPIFGQQF